MPGKCLLDFSDWICFSSSKSSKKISIFLENLNFQHMTADNGVNGRRLNLWKRWAGKFHKFSIAAAGIYGVDPRALSGY